MVRGVQKSRFYDKMRGVHEVRPRVFLVQASGAANDQCQPCAACWARSACSACPCCARLRPASIASRPWGKPPSPHSRAPPRDWTRARVAVPLRLPCMAMAPAASQFEAHFAAALKRWRARQVDELGEVRLSTRLRRGSRGECGCRSLPTRSSAPPTRSASAAAPSQAAHAEESPKTHGAARRVVQPSPAARYGAGGHNIVGGRAPPGLHQRQALPGQGAAARGRWLRRERRVPHPQGIRAHGEERGAGRGAGAPRRGGATPGAGYTWVNVDDCYLEKGRDPVTNKLRADPARCAPPPPPPPSNT